MCDCGVVLVVVGGGGHQSRKDRRPRFDRRALEDRRCHRRCLRRGVRGGPWQPVAWDVALDELAELTALEEDRAKSLIMAARAHWFSGEQGKEAA